MSYQGEGEVDEPRRLGVETPRPSFRPREEERPPRSCTLTVCCDVALLFGCVASVPAVELFLVVVVVVVVPSGEGLDVFSPVKSLEDMYE